ncbi:MAG: hypothetical protein HQK91_14590 [Nitrospirae bacterium]|nr:hypothetical protein [Nitrospirota bacterium]
MPIITERYGGNGSIVNQLLLFSFIFSLISIPVMVMLFEDRNLKFDIGRKSIHGSQARIYKEYASRIFYEYIKYVARYVGGEVSQDTEWSKDEIYAEIDKIIDLNVSTIKFQKNPKNQEASVAAIFYECIGNGIIKDILPLISGYRNRYDLYAKWNNKKIVIEFKAKLINILRDFNDEQKMFNEINCIVCWDVDDSDKQGMKDKGISLDEITQSSFDNGNKKFPHSTHFLTLSGLVPPIYIIDLKKIIS